MERSAAFSALRAPQRAAALLDRDSFVPLTAVTPGTPFVAGAGCVDGAPVLIALTDGHVRGGTIGLRESGILARLAEGATSMQVRGQRPRALILGFDTGGVRVEEGPVALAAASAVGVALARLTLLGVRQTAVISGPRGCFGAMSVMAALPERIIMTADAHWGLTGPRLLGEIAGDAPQGSALDATAAAAHVENGDVHAVVADDAAAVHAEVRRFVAAPGAARAPTLVEQADRCAADAATLCERLVHHRRPAPPAAARRRDLLRYSFRGQWQPTGAIERAGLVDAASGTLAGRPALGLIIGPERTAGGVGIEEAAVITRMIAQAVRAGARAPILTFLFCQGHAVDTAQERFGLPRALADCLRSMVVARLLGHPIISVLGGGTYGAAYLALAAPSHRILAMRGTSVAPMAPKVLEAFQALRGRKSGQETEQQLAELIPDIRMVDSVIRLPRVLRAELTELLASVQPEVHAA